MLISFPCLKKSTFALRVFVKVFESCTIKQILNSQVFLFEMSIAESSRNKYMNLHQFVHNEMIMSQHQLDFLPPSCNRILDRGKRLQQRRDMARTRGLYARFMKPRWNTDPRPTPPQKYESLASAEAKLHALDEGLLCPYKDLSSDYFSLTPTVPNGPLYSGLSETNENCREMYRLPTSSRQKPNLSKFSIPASSARTPLKGRSTYRDLIRTLEHYGDSREEHFDQEEYWEENEKYWRDYNRDYNYNNSVSQQKGPPFSSQSKVTVTGTSTPCPTPDFNENTSESVDSSEIQNEFEYTSELPEASGGYGPFGDGVDSCAMATTNNNKPKSFSDTLPREESNRCPLPRGPCHLHSLTPRCRAQQPQSREDCPMSTKRPLLRFPLRTQNYCGCMGCRPDFWACTKPRST